MDPNKYLQLTRRVEAIFEFRHPCYSQGEGMVAYPLVHRVEWMDYNPPMQYDPANGKPSLFYL